MISAAINRNSATVTLCRMLRRQSDIQVIFITARGREEDILSGFDLGCDDYIVKPFLLSVLCGKCEAHRIYSFHRARFVHLRMFQFCGIRFLSEISCADHSKLNEPSEGLPVPLKVNHIAFTPSGILISEVNFFHTLLFSISISPSSLPFHAVLTAKVPPP